MAAARRIIETEGPAQLTLRGAAKLSSVSVAAPYRHFADKEALLAAVLTEGFAGLAAEMTRARAAAADPKAALIGVGKAYVRFAAANASVFRLMFGPTIDKEKHAELRDTAQGALAQLHEAVAACHARGLFARGVTVEEVALAGWSICHGLAALQTDGALDRTMPVDVEQAGDRVIHFLLHGVMR